MYILDLRHIIFASEDIPALDTLLQMHGCQIGITKQQVANIGNHSPLLVVLFRDGKFIASRQSENCQYQSISKSCMVRCI